MSAQNLVWKWGFWRKTGRPLAAGAGAARVSPRARLELDGARCAQARSGVSWC